MSDIQTIGLADGAVLAVFFAAIVAITVATARRASNTQGYFLATDPPKGGYWGFRLLACPSARSASWPFPPPPTNGNWGWSDPLRRHALVAIIADRLCLPLYRRINVTSGL